MPLVAKLKDELYLDFIRFKNFIGAILILVITVSGLVVFSDVYKYDDIWQNMTVALGNAFNYCELSRPDQLIAQPSNTWSNLGFFVVALIILTLGVNDWRNKKKHDSPSFIVNYPVFSVLFGIITLYIFISSFVYHASLTVVFQKLDISGIYFLMILSALINIYLFFPEIKIRKKVFSSHGLAVLLFVVIGYFSFQNLSVVKINTIFPIAVGIVFTSWILYLLFISKNAFILKYATFSYILLVLAGGIWILDRTHTVCDPNSPFQGHALWHVLNAISILLIYFYYRSQKVNPLSLS